MRRRCHPCACSPFKLSAQVNTQHTGGREIIVNRYAAEAVLKGADVFSPGLMAISPGVSAGDLVAVTVAIETK